MTRQRIGTITTETGSVITVNYELASACTSADQANPAGEHRVLLPGAGGRRRLSSPQKDWFNRYQVASVTQSDPFGGNATQYTGYAYPGGAAWHYDDNEVVKAAYRTYGQFRGFGDVITTTGQGNDTPTRSETTYYRGMSDDNDATAVTLTDSQGGGHDDADQLAGDTLETTSYAYSRPRRGRLLRRRRLDHRLLLGIGGRGVTSPGRAARPDREHDRASRGRSRAPRSITGPRRRGGTPRPTPATTPASPTPPSACPSTPTRTATCP